MQEIIEFIGFFRTYLFLRLVRLGKIFEGFKDVVVAFLIVKRGKYSSSFLNTSFFILVGAALVGGPIIAENNSFLRLFESEYKPQFSEATVVSYNPYESGLATTISVKPRDRIIDHKIVSGDTLETLGKRYGISVDTIKWANNLKNDTIMPGQTLKIPPVTGVVHKVVSGESIYSIAKKYKTSPQNIVNFIFNDFLDIDTFALRSGQTLFVPDGVIEEEQPKYLALKPSYASIQAGVRGSSSFIWPTSGLITQYPTWYHMALDIANNAAPPVLASDTGTVTFAGCLQYGYGCHIVIDHANGYTTLYGHLSAIGVSAGQAVTQGQQIGNVGSTGRSTGPHLHFEIRSGGTLLNPQDFLR